MNALVSGNLIEALIEVLFYGLYFVLFITTIYLFRRRHGIPPRSRPALWVLLGLTAQFIAITLHWGSTMYRTIYALGTLGGGSAAFSFYSNLTHPSFVMNIALLVISHTITDSFVLHRLYVIFCHERKVMYFPSAVLVVQIVSAIGLVVRAATSKVGEDYLQLSNGWLTCKLVASIVISLYSSVMIFIRILRVQRAFGGRLANQNGSVQLTSLLGILVESAALQLAVAILLLLSFQLKWLAGEYISTGTAGAAFAITTVLIHARIGLGWTKEDSLSGASSSNPPSRINFASGAAPPSTSKSTFSFQADEKTLESV
uniref:Integral membrane protein n=1 Tax=Mycena chlorophos TaxID=658473 RepID=A0ABQ0M219_MYCCL|nr:predicted protein [Mycena chlorophos]